MNGRPFVFFLAFVLAGCAAERAYDKGLELIQSGNVADGLGKMEQAHRLDPHSQLYRQAYFRHRDVALQREMAAGELARKQTKWNDAEAAYKRMLRIDPGNARARSALNSLRLERQHADKAAKAGELMKKGDSAAALSVLRKVLTENPSQRDAQQLARRIEDEQQPQGSEPPQLAAALREPIKLDFRDATLRQIFEVISRTTGIDFIFDRDVRLDQRTTVFVRNSSIDDVMRFLLVTNQLDRKVLADNMILVYPNNAAKQRDYQELVARTFYISNGDAKNIANMIKTVVKTKDMHIDDKLNAIVMRDTADAVRMAERLVANLDLPDAEVMLEVEVLEVGSNSLYELGIQYPDKLSLSVVGANGTPGTLSLPEWRSGRADLVRITVSDPLCAVNLRNILGQSNLFANPRIRVKNKDKAKVHIGDKIPVVTTTTTATGFAAESVSYLDVGLKLEVEPTVSLEAEVSIKVGLEVSSIAREIRTNTGGITYQVGTRNAATTLRLRDGETQVLAGLISDEERKSASQIPGLGSLPVVGRLFGNHSDSSNKTEIVLLITPRIVRNLPRPDARHEKFASGTEAAIGARPFALYTAAAQPGTSALAKEPPLTEVAVQTPGTVPAGQEFTASVILKGKRPVQRASLEFAFDPSRLTFVRAEPGAMVLAADKDPQFRANVAANEGRVNVALSSNRESAGAGELVKLIFQTKADASGAPLLRLESLSLSGATGDPFPSAPPPPVKLSITR